MTSKAKKLFLFIGTLTSMLTACLGLETRHSNHLGWALLLMGTAFTALGCLYLGALYFRNGGKQSGQDRSLWLLALGVLIISLATPLEYLYLPTVLPRTDFAQDAGLILFGGGLVLYLLSQRFPDLWKTMPTDRRAYFHGKSSSLASWRILRSPIPISILLAMIGLGIGYSSLAGLLILLLVVLLALFWQKHPVTGFLVI